MASRGELANTCNLRSTTRVTNWSPESNSQNMGLTCPTPNSRCRSTRALFGEIESTTCHPSTTLHVISI